MGAFYATHATTSAGPRTATLPPPNVGKGKGPAAHAPPAKAGANPHIPQFTPARQPGIHLEGSLLKNSMVKPIQVSWQFFTWEMVESIVMHTNTYAYICVASGGYKRYTLSDRSWQETT